LLAGFLPHPASCFFEAPIKYPIDPTLLEKLFKNY